MRNDHGVDICIGLGRSPNDASISLAACFVDAFGNRGVHVAINRPFSARRPSTITSFVQRLGATALQIEIAAKYRQPIHHPESAKQLLDVFISVLNKLE